MPLRLIALLCGLVVLMAPVLRGQVAVPPPLVWFAPAPASLDLRDLFLDGRKNPAVDWQDVREQVQVFKFYTAQLLDNNEASWPNTFEALRDVRAFRKLVDWRLAIAIEVASVKEYSCDSAAAVAGLARALMDRIEREDAWVSYLALDEPFLSGAYDCHQPEARTAALVADFTRTVAPQRPKLKIGLIEPYPTFRVDQLARFFRLVEEQGGRLDFLHLDVDMSVVRALQARDAIDLAGDLRTLDAFARARGIPFGYIVWGNAGESDSGVLRGGDDRRCAHLARRVPRLDADARARDLPELDPRPRRPRAGPAQPAAEHPVHAHLPHRPWPALPAGPRPLCLVRAARPGTCAGISRADGELAHRPRDLQNAPPRKPLSFLDRPA